MNHKKTFILLLTAAVLTTTASSQLQQGAGIDQKVQIGIDRNEDKTLFQKVELHCLQNNYTFCEDDPGLIEAIFVLLEQEKLGEKWLGENNSNNTEENVTVIH